MQFPLANGFCVCVRLRTLAIKSNHKVKTVWIASHSCCLYVCCWLWDLLQTIIQSLMFSMGLWCLNNNCKCFSSSKVTLHSQDNKQEEHVHKWTHTHVQEAGCKQWTCSATNYEPTVCVHGLKTKFIAGTRLAWHGLHTKKERVTRWTRRMSVWTGK